VHSLGAPPALVAAAVRRAASTCVACVTLLGVHARVRASVRARARAEERRREGRKRGSGSEYSESAWNDGCTRAITIPLQREFLTVA